MVVLLITEDLSKSFLNFGDGVKIVCFNFVIFIHTGSRSGSPVIAEACQTTSQKRKLQPDDEDDEVKGQ
jgi:hypothetical protein